VLALLKIIGRGVTPDWLRFADCVTNISGVTAVVLKIDGRDNGLSH